MSSNYKKPVEITIEYLIYLDRILRMQIETLYASNQYNHSSPPPSIPGYTTGQCLRSMYADIVNNLQIFDETNFRSPRRQIYLRVDELDVNPSPLAKYMNNTSNTLIITAVWVSRWLKLAKWRMIEIQPKYYQRICFLMKGNPKFFPLKDQSIAMDYIAKQFIQKAMTSLSPPPPYKEAPLPVHLSRSASFPSINPLQQPLALLHTQRVGDHREQMRYTPPLQQNGLFQSRGVRDLTDVILC
jgi:hypothetical protein